MRREREREKEIVVGEWRRRLRASQTEKEESGVEEIAKIRVSP